MFSMAYQSMLARPPHLVLFVLAKRAQGAGRPFAPQRQKAEVQAELLAMDIDDISGDVEDLRRKLVDYTKNDKHHQNWLK